MLSDHLLRIQSLEDEVRALTRLRELEQKDAEARRCYTIDLEASLQRARAEIVGLKETNSMLKFQLEMLAQNVDLNRLAKGERQ